jgi:hypothetical protein
MAVNVKTEVFGDVPLHGLILTMKISHSCIVKVGQQIPPELPSDHTV